MMIWIFLLMSDSSKLGRYLGLVKWLVDITRSLEGVAGLCPEAGGLVLEGCCGLPAVHVLVLVEVDVGPDQAPVAGLARPKVPRQRSAGVLLVRAAVRWMLTLRRSQLWACLVIPCVFLEIKGGNERRAALRIFAITKLPVSERESFQRSVPISGKVTVF